MQKHIREKRIRETGLFFTSCPHETTAGRIFLTICRFVLFLHLVVKPLGMNVTIFPLIFYSKITPLCPLHQSKTIAISLS